MIKYMKLRHILRIQLQKSVKCLSNQLIDQPFTFSLQPPASTPTASPGQFHTMRYIGCYSDTWNRALPVEAGSVEDVESCSIACKSYGHFGTEDGQQCWSGNSISAATQYGTLKAFNPNQMRGFWAFNLFEHRWNVSTKAMLPVVIFSTVTIFATMNLVIEKKGVAK